MLGGISTTVPVPALGIDLVLAGDFGPAGDGTAIAFGLEAEWTTASGAEPPFAPSFVPPATAFGSLPGALLSPG